MSINSGTDIVGSMVVFKDGKPIKSQYKKFKIRDMEDQDDYGSMCQMVARRIERYLSADQGFCDEPELMLIDGGAVHAAAVLAIVNSYGLNWPVFGMVKDDRHRTRALVTANNQIIAIDNHQAVFSLIGNIQEETHRFAITYHRTLRSKRLSRSSLDNIPGIGPKRKEQMLKMFKSISAIKEASVLDLEQILPRTTAKAVYDHFHNTKE